MSKLYRSSEMRRLQTSKEQQDMIARKSCYKSTAALESNPRQKHTSSPTSRRNKVRKGRLHRHASPREQVYRRRRQPTSLEEVQPLLRHRNGRTLTPLPYHPPELGHRCQRQYLWTPLRRPPPKNQASHPMPLQTLHSRPGQCTSNRQTGTTGS